MKKIIVAILMICFGVIAYKTIYIKEEGELFDYNLKKSSAISKGSLFTSPESTIEESLKESKKNNNIDKFLDLEKQLQNEYNKTSSSLVLYWQAYLGYAKSRYYNELGYMDKAKEEILGSVEILERITLKNSDDYALLGMLQGFAIPFLKKQKVVVYSIKARKNIAESLKLDSTNVRGHFVAANNDAYTPKEFGGGQIIEKHLKKAIELSPKTSKNSFSPSWGKIESYSLLIFHYRQIGEMDKADNLLKRFNKLYPEQEIMGFEID
ncbi:hypothetical protein HME9304_02181 [Flagellimonas maritima]|uniref:Tetratricopeptide repeat protein n=1 Tax=Flagellimonas maritima TaxID=1383885 RepID=A0A2Z4LTA2_9FLAO|nr:hypothetical protein [Allomuricauda aurantiaca]AWX45171.1 hypothetical protein HME9304_02181 [Allomuricauda aurantiaca]